MQIKWLDDEFVTVAGLKTLTDRLRSKGLSEVVMIMNPRNPEEKIHRVPQVPQNVARSSAAIKNPPDPSHVPCV